MIKILILSANPKNTDPLRLDEEVREIREGLRRSTYRDNFEITQRWAVGLKDLRRALLDEEPDIVHFRGHANEQEICVEDESGKPVPASTEAISELFALFSDKLRCVVLNACYTKVQAETISSHIDYVIGMSGKISNKTAIEFAVGFYDGLGAGKSVEIAVKLGRNAIALKNIPETDSPVLKKKGASLHLLPNVKQKHTKEQRESEAEIKTSTPSPPPVPDDAGKQPMSPLSYTVISMLSLLFIVLLFIFFKPAESELLTGYIVIILTGLLSAAFLFGGMRSYASYKRLKRNKPGTQQRKLELGGPVVLFLLVVIIGINSITKPGPFDFTLFLRDANGKTALKNKGHIQVRFDSNDRTAEIDKSGSVYFKRIPAKFRNKQIPVELDADGWQFTNDKTVINCNLNGEHATLIIERDDSLCCLSGRVTGEDGNPVIDATVAVKDIEVKTNKNGYFELKIPPVKQEKTQRLTISKPGYKTKTSDEPVGSGQEIQLILVKSEQ